MRYRAEIDGLRALAVIPVVLFHAGIPHASGGFVGVDVFFVISGYLMAIIILGGMRDGTFSVLGFYERRARRILPALMLVMACCLPFAWMWMTPPQLAEFAESVVAASLFVSNLLFWKQSGYFGTDAETLPLLHTWSLGVEEQLYLLFHREAFHRRVALLAALQPLVDDGVHARGTRRLKALAHADEAGAMVHAELRKGLRRAQCKQAAGGAWRLCLGKRARRAVRQFVGKVQFGRVVALQIESCRRGAHG